MWLPFLKPNPVCEICGKNLKYFSGNRKTTVNFDHKYKNTPIKEFPSDWLRTNKPVEENLLKWKKSNFGILCNKCNRFLITDNRKKWIVSVVKYVFNKNT